MRLEELGYNINLEKFRIDNNLSIYDKGRVIAEHKDRYIVKTENGEFDAEITGICVLQPKAVKIFLLWAIGLPCQCMMMRMPSFTGFYPEALFLKDKW